MNEQQPTYDAMSLQTVDRLASEYDGIAPRVRIETDLTPEGRTEFVAAHLEITARPRSITVIRKG